MAASICGGLPPGTLEVEDVDHPVSPTNARHEPPLPREDVRPLDEDGHGEVRVQPLDDEGRHEDASSADVPPAMTFTLSTNSCSRSGWNARLPLPHATLASPKEGLQLARDGIQNGLTTAKTHARDGLVQAKDGLVQAKDAAVNMKDEVKEGVRRNVKKMTARKEHIENLANTIPQVGVLVDTAQFGSTADETEENDDAARQPIWLPEGTTAAMDLEVSYYGEPHRLLVLRHGSPDGLSSPAKGILDLLQLVRECKATSTAMAWPLHDPKVSEAVMAMETEELAYATGMENLPCWQRTVFKILRALRITSPSAERVDILEEHYGPAVEFMFTWSAFFIQQLWLLVIYAVITLLVKAKERRNTDDRWIYELMKVGVVLWSAWVALCSTRRYNVTLHGSSDPSGSTVRRSDFQLSTWKSKELRRERIRRWALLLFVALPMISFIVAVVLLTFAGVTMLVLRVIFIWGDCLTLHSPDSVCRDATVKYSILGWAAEVACDILLAVLFELFFTMGSAFSMWVAGLLNYRYQSDMLLFKSMLEKCLATLERIGFVGCLAFFFVPQWSAPTCHGVKRLSDCSCSDFWGGSNDFRCFQRRLPLEMRRWLFESLMKGPFIVAPFINIVVKVLVPKLVECLASSCGHSSKWKCCIWLAPVRGLVRFFTLIFAYDGHSVRCFTYIWRGSPFGRLPRDLPRRDEVAYVLKQFKVKSFDVEDELTELEMSLIWVVFFMPLLPQGVIVTMVAKLIEVNTDLTKMLFVRRRPVPADDRVMRREISVFAWCVVVAGAAWTCGLSLITYKDKLHEWDYGGLGIFLGMAVFMLGGPMVTTWVVNRCSVRRPSHSFRVRPESSLPRSSPFCSDASVRAGSLSKQRSESPADASVASSAKPYSESESPPAES